MKKILVLVLMVVLSVFMTACGKEADVTVRVTVDDFKPITTEEIITEEITTETIYTENIIIEQAWEEATTTWDDV